MLMSINVLCTGYFYRETTTFHFTNNELLNEFLILEVQDSSFDHDCVFMIMTFTIWGGGICFNGISLVHLHWKCMNSVKNLVLL